jgi:DNA-binding response OmpR family regulator
VREFRLLEYLATHRGRVLTRDQLLDAVWKETPFVTPAIDRRLYPPPARED